MADLSQDRVVSNNQKLYNNLLKSGKVTQDEIGDFNTFNTLLSDSSNASKLRDNLISKKNFSEAELGSHDDFLQNLDPLEGTTNKPDQTRPQQSSPVKPGTYNDWQIEYDEANQKETTPLKIPSQTDRWLKENSINPIIQSLPFVRGIYKGVKDMAGVAATFAEEEILKPIRDIGSISSGKNIDTRDYGFSNTSASPEMIAESKRLNIPLSDSRFKSQWEKAEQQQGTSLDEYRPAISENTKNIRDWQAKVPTTSGAADFVGQLIPQVATLIPVILSRNPTIGKLYIGQMAATSYGTALQSYDDYIKESGEKYNSEDRTATAFGYAAAEYFAEKIGLDYFMPKGYGKVISKSLLSNPKVATKIGKEVLETYARATKQSIGQILKKITSGSLIEGGEEGLTELMQIALDKYITHKDIGKDEVIDRLIQAVAGGALMGKIITPFSMSAQKASDKNRRRKQGTVTVSISEDGTPLELIKDKNNIIGLTPNGEIINEISEETINKAATFTTNQFESGLADFKKNGDQISKEWEESILQKNNEKISNAANIGAVSFKNIAARTAAKKEFEQASASFNDIPNANYTEAVKNLLSTYTDPKEIITNFNKISSEIGVEGKEYETALNFLSSSVKVNSLNKAKQAEIQKGIDDFQDDKGNVTSAEIEGEKYYIKNSADLGQPGRIIFAKNQKGEVKPFNASLVKNWSTLTPDQITQIAQQKEAEEDNQFNASQEASAAASQVGIEPNKSVKTPNGIAKVVSVNNDGTVTVINQKGLQDEFSIDEVEAYKTEEQKQAEKEALTQQQENEKIQLQQQEDTAKQEAKIQQQAPEQQSTETTPEQPSIPKDKDGNPDYDAMDPEVFFNEYAKEFSEEEAKTEIQDMQRAIIEDIKKKTTKKSKATSANERAAIAREIKSLNTRLDNINGVLQKDRSKTDLGSDTKWIAKNSSNPDEIVSAYEQEKSNAPVNNLKEWQKFITGVKFNPDSFNRFGDKNNITSTLAKTWLNSDGHDIDQFIRDNFEDVPGFEDVTEQDVIDFITENPTGQLRKTTDTQNELRKRYREITGVSIDNHKFDNETLPTQAKLESFLTENNLNDSWFTTEDLQSLVTENKDKLNENDYNEFTDYLSRELTTKQSELDEWDFDDTEPSIQTEISASEDSDSKKLSSTKEVEPIEFSQSSLLNEATPEVKSTEGDASIRNQKIIEAHRQIDSYILQAQTNYDEAQAERYDYIQKNGYPIGEDATFHKLVVKTRDAEDRLNKLLLAKENLLPLPNVAKNNDINQVSDQIVYHLPSETPTNTKGATQTSETLLQNNENKQSESEPNFRVQDKSEAQQTIEYLQSIDKSKRNVIYLGKSDIIQYLKDNRRKYSRNTIDQVKNANFSAFYLRDEIFINSDKVKTKEDVVTNWIHERVHAQTKETLNNEELSLLYDQIGLREIQRIIPRIYWLETPNIQADEYISFASETLLANGKLDDKIPSDIQNIILNIVNNITSINNLTNGKNNLDNFQQGIEGRNAYVGDSDRRGTEQDRTDSEGNGVGSGTRLRPDEKGSKVTFSDQANIDLKDRHNAIASITKIGTELNIPVNVVNSSELTSDNGQTALTDNGTVTIVSDRVKSVSEVIKALVKEVAGEKGIREILANADPNSIVGKQLAKYDELSPEELQSDKLAQVIRKAFRFTSGQFSQSDLFNIINEQRERMTKGQKTNIETGETNIENDRTTVNEPKNTYKTKEGQEIQYTLTFGDDNKSTTNDLQQDENRQQNPSLRRLKEGEMASVEMKYTLDKNYIFDGRNKIESAEDIAYLFRQLENKSVENMFACLVDENQKPTIIHISMGGRAGTVIDFGVLADAVSRFSPKKVYLIHNHPSGNLVASDADIQIHTKAKDAFGEDLIGEHIIINTTSGKYASFNHKYDYDTNSRPKTVETPQNYKVLKFDKQVFKDTTEPFKVTGSKSVAKFISAQRFSSGDKLSVLILARNNDIKAYLHLPSVDFSSKESVLGLKTELQAYAGRFGGHSLILSGNTFNIKDPNESRRNIRYLKALLKSIDISLLDLVEVESDLKWVSMVDEDLMEPKEKYGDKIEEDYPKWKRKNVTLRGIKELGSANDVYGSFGNGLYTVPLNNKSMAKQYGEVYFVVNAIPKDPKIVNSLNDAELVRQNLVNSYCKKHEVNYSVKYFNEHTSMESEMLNIGYDGLIVKGREMVNYTPENVKYFKTEQELKNYHESLLNQPRFRIIGEQGATNLDKAEEATTRLDNLAIAREMEKGKSIENARLKFFDDIPDELKNDARIVNRGEDANGESMKRIQSNPRAKSAWADYIRAQEHMTEWNSLSEKEQNRRIRLATGWEKGVDGKWRYETDDSGITFKKDVIEELKNNQKLANKTHEFRNLTYRKNEDGSYDFTMVKKGATSISDIATYRNIPNSELEYIFDNNTDLISKVRNGEGQPGLIGAELDESAKELNIEFEHYVSGGTDLGSLIENKEMFKEYPQLKKVVVVFDPKSTSQGSFGKDLDGQNVITVKSLSGNQFKSTLLHEIQHAIQDIEGFAKGGNTEMLKNLSEKNKQAVNKIHEIDKELGFDDWAKNNIQLFQEGKSIDDARSIFAKTIPSGQKYIETVSKIKQIVYDNVNQAGGDKIILLSDQQYYRNLAGEVEARNVQTRMNMTPEERRNALLSETEDVAREDQIVLMDGLGVSKLELPETITVNGVERPTTNSKGQPIADSEEKIRSFYKWFGDSKVVDEEGRPMVVYHGTVLDKGQEPFSEFNIGELGIHFGNLEQANKRANRFAFIKSIDHGIKPHMIESYLKIENPIYSWSDTRDWSEGFELERVLHKSGSISDSEANSIGWNMDQDYIRQELIDLGYDGIKYKNSFEGDGNSYIVFSNDQIKSATGKTGSFSPETNYIRFRVATKPKEDYNLTEDEDWKFTMDLQTAISGKISHSDYQIVNGNTLLRIKNHTPNWINFADDLENNPNIKRVINVTVGDYNNTDYRRNKTDMEAFEEQYPNVELIDMPVEDGESLYDNIDVLSKYLNKPFQDDIRFRINKASEEVNTNPTDAQKEAGNYKKGHIKFDGFDISIENPKGSTRSGVDQDGNKWSNQMGADYGYIKGTVGKDKDHIDVFIGNKPELNKAYVVDQINPKTGKFDEHKVMLGFDGVTEARKAYQASYPKDWKGLNNITRTTKQGLKDWFENGNTKKPFADGDVRFRMAYHGSPHQFDKFTTEKIGTGEGAQAFGWGLYFTDKKSIAESYARPINWQKYEVYSNGKRLNSYPEPISRLNEYLTDPKYINEVQKGDLSSIKSYFEREVKSRENAFINAKSDYDRVESWNKSTYKPILENKENALNRDKKTLEFINSNPEILIKENPKNLYTVELHQGKEPGEYDYLRWDKPVGEKVIDKLKEQYKKEGLYKEWQNYKDETRNSFDQINIQPDSKGEQVYSNLSSVLKGQEAASKFLLRAGIDGIQYPTESVSSPKNWSVNEFVKLDGAKKYTVQLNGKPHFDNGKLVSFDSTKEAEDYISKNESFNYVIFDENAVEVKEHVRFRQSDITKDLSSVEQLSDIAFKVSQKSANTVPENQNEDTEKAMNKAHGLKGETILSKIDRWKQEVKETTQHFKYVTEKEFPQIYNDLRLFESIPEVVKKDAYDKIADIVRPIANDKNLYKAFERYVVISDLMHDIKSGIYTNTIGIKEAAELKGVSEKEIKDLIESGAIKTMPHEKGQRYQLYYDSVLPGAPKSDTYKQLPFSMKSVDEVETYYNELREYIDKNPSLRKVIANRNSIIYKVRDQLIENNLMSEKARDNTSYFHHMVMKYRENPEKSTAINQSYDVRVHPRGWQKSRTGSMEDYNTDYLQSEFEVIAQSLEQLAVKKSLQKIGQEVDIMPALVAQANNEGGSWRDFVPEGYTTWRPKPETNAWAAASMAEKAIQSVIEGNPLTESLNEQLAEADQTLWVIPTAVANQLDEMKTPTKEKLPIRGMRFFNSTWKQWILLNPARLSKYMINNFSGDLDIVFAYNPKILQPKYAWTAAKELYNEATGKGMSKDMREAIENAVISSGLSIQEIPDVNKEGVFKTLTGENNLFKKYWNTATSLNDFREGMLRLAAYKFFKEELNAGKTHHGVSNPKAVDALRSNEEKAGKMARELLGDYGNLSQGGVWLRSHAYPFWSWMEINAPRYYKLLRNTYQDTNSAPRTVGAAIRKTAISSTALAARIMLLSALITAWNRLFFPDEDDELTKTGNRQLRLITGRRDDGSIVTLRIQGAFSDVLSFVGLEDAYQDVKDVRTGKTTAGKKVKEAGSAFVNRVGQGAMPFERLTGELITGKSAYPDILHPRPIIDRAEHAFRMVSLDKVYRFMTKKPLKKGGKELIGLVLYETDPGEAAYYAMRQRIYNFLDEKEYERPSGDPTEKSIALRYYKQAKKFKDTKLENHWWAKYKALGGTKEGMKMSIKKGEVTSALPKEYKREFLDKLDGEDREVLQMAEKWYDETYKK